MLLSYDRRRRRESQQRAATFDTLTISDVDTVMRCLRKTYHYFIVHWDIP
jgi:hypothetical protein